MINVNFLNIDNAKMIGRLLPFWSRGRKVSLFLQAILSPLVAVHESFKTWALEKYIECHITAQRGSLEWYLKYRLKYHFLNDSENFSIEENNEFSDQTIVYAPAIVDTINYDHEDYERDIRYIMSKFMINFNKINVIVADNK